MHKTLTAAGLTTAVAGALLAVPLASITAMQPETPASAGTSAPPTRAEHEIDQPADVSSLVKSGGEQDSLTNPFSRHGPHHWVADQPGWHPEIIKIDRSLSVPVNKLIVRGAW
ncbi:hypothetical protein ACWEBX_38425 [Streptomyces sp. NPDC005070]